MKNFFLILLLPIVISSGYSQVLPSDPSGTKPSKKIALVLSGGGARGLAHLGVLRALDEIGVRPQLVVGSSIGAVIGAMYACGYPVDYIIANIRAVNFDQVFIRETYRESVFASEKFEELTPAIRLRFDQEHGLHFPSNLLPTQSIFEIYFNQMVAPEFYSRGNFDSLDIPFRAVATDIKTGQSIVLDHGNLPKVLVSSSAIPLVFEPVLYDKYLLVDGGITNNVPADVAKKWGADYIIGVDIASHVRPIQDISNPIELFNQSLNVLSVHSDTKNLGLVDLLIHPELTDISSGDFQMIDSLITLGYQQTMTHRSELEVLVPYSKPKTRFSAEADSTLRQTRITAFEIKGLRRLRPYMVTSEISLKQGQVWDYNRGLRSLRNLFSTNYFNSVAISIQRTSPVTAKMVVDVDEKLSKVIALGAFYNNQRRLRAFVEVKNESVFGQSIYLHIAGIIGDQMRGARILTGNSRFFSTPFTAFHKIQFMDENIPLYQDGALLAFGKLRKVEINTNFGIQVRRLGLTSFGWKRIWMYPTRQNDFLITGGHYDLSAVTFRIFSDNTDDIDFPSRGRQNHFLLERGLAGLGSNYDYLQAIYQSKIHFSFSNQRVVTFMLYSTYQNRDLPFFSNFRFGGEEHLVGTYEGELWGKNFVSTGLRYRHRFTQNFYWYAQINTGGAISDFKSINQKELNTGVGLGLMFQSPLGPFSVGYGYVNSSHQLLYLSVGHSLNP